jgi:hypothetical protein
MTFTNPPNSNGHICYYGYDMEAGWFAKYARENSPNVQDDEVSLLIAAMEVLKARSGIRNLQLEIAQVNPKAVSDRSVAPFTPTEPRYVHVISLFSSTSYKNRPTQAKVDALTETLDRQPAWWIGFASDSQFP